MDDQPINPFASPSDVSTTSISDSDPVAELPPFRLKYSVIKWVLVCAISGAPSLVVGFSLGEEPVVQTAAMLLGILTFAGLYVFIESREPVRRTLTNTSLRIALKIGYGTRVAISIVFPIALYVDLLCGMFSVSFVSAIFGDLPYFENSFLSGSITQPQQLFLWFYITTLVQGVLLNVVLGGYTLVAFAITIAWRRRANRLSKST